ncbi:MAG: protein phosphatase 2C domain-containing protein [Clostridia bacterium]
MTFSVAKRCCCGGKRYNEDNVGVTITSTGFLAALADGFGGHGCGAAASRIAIDSLSAGFSACPSAQTGCVEALMLRVHHAVLARQTPQRRMKSTLVSLLCCTNGIAVAHAGDSRLYLFRNGRLVFQTIDHTVAQMAVFAGEIRSNDIRAYKDRNKVLRAVGMEGKFMAEVDHPVDKVREGDAFLLCSDGLWGLVNEDEMIVDLCKAEDPEAWLDSMLLRIGNRMDATGDNFSAVAVFAN